MKIAGFKSPKNYKNGVEYTPIISENGEQYRGGAENALAWKTDEGIYFLPIDFFNKYQKVQIEPFVLDNEGYENLLKEDIKRQKIEAAANDQYA